jgi:catechol 2,3-dioxygenase-like lactoylglutathione lyase family enzyme
LDLPSPKFSCDEAPFTLGVVGHFGLAVRNPKKSAEWFQVVLGLRKEFEFENGIAVGNQNVTIVLFKGEPSPQTLEHMSFHLPDMRTLRKALRHLKKHDVDLEDPGDEIGPEAPGSPQMGLGSTISMAIAGSCQSRAGNELPASPACPLFD